MCVVSQTVPSRERERDERASLGATHCISTRWALREALSSSIGNILSQVIPVRVCEEAVTTTDGIDELGLLLSRNTS